MWRKLPDFRAEKKAWDPVTSLAVMVSSVPKPIKFSVEWYTHPDLRFLAFFGKQLGKPPKKQGFLLLAEPLKSLGKKGKNAQNRKEFLEKEKGKENQKGKEKEIRAYRWRTFQLRTVPLRML